MATTFDLTSGAVKTNLGGLVTAINVVDFSSNNVAASDVVQVIKVPADCILIKAGSLILTAEGGTATATFGIGGAVDAIDASVNFNATAGTSTIMLEATDTYGAGHYFSAADTLDYVPANALDTAKVLTWAQFIQIDSTTTQRA